MLRSIGLPELLILLLFTGGVIVPFWKIFVKLGFSGWLSLLMIVPLVNIVVPYIVAFSGRTITPARSAGVVTAFCTKCGEPVNLGVRFCGACGRPT
jgi:zinc-ribbon domain